MDFLIDQNIVHITDLFSTEFKHIKEIKLVKKIREEE